MRTNLNVALQAGSLLAFVGLRFTAPGWFLIILIITLVGPVLLTVPSILALTVLRRRVLAPAVTAPFVACASFLLAAGLLMPDFGDTQDSVRAPLSVLMESAGLAAGPSGPLYVLGSLAVAGWSVSMLWLGVALALDARRTHRVAGPPHPAWVRPSA
ncbi:hypothetical protein [Pseudonocardia sp. ICBG1293]|uniref:hypothetical protein n=1 Tax=Pseudonocardia sp. ICBG1293 TaxID=2844382 RepID=UPI001CCEB24C|nr:hypothetical protein [Pseudonocardia sp. ICBG1293]